MVTPHQLGSPQLLTVIKHTGQARQEPTYRRIQEEHLHGQDKAKMYSSVQYASLGSDGGVPMQVEASLQLWRQGPPSRCATRVAFM